MSNPTPQLIEIANKLRDDVYRLHEDTNQSKGVTLTTAEAELLLPFIERLAGVAVTGTKG